MAVVLCTHSGRMSWSSFALQSFLGTRAARSTGTNVPMVKPPVFGARPNVVLPPTQQVKHRRPTQRHTHGASVRVGAVEFRVKYERVDDRPPPATNHAMGHPTQDQSEQLVWQHLHAFAVTQRKFWTGLWNGHIWYRTQEEEVVPNKVGVGRWSGRGGSTVWCQVTGTA